MTTLFVILTLLQPASPAVAQLNLDTAVRESMDHWNLPGVVVVVVKDGKTLVDRGYGTRVVGEDRPVDEHTLVQIASHSKAVTATALAMLVDAGRIGWDDPVKKYIPEFQLDHPWAADEITIRDLVSHRAGLPAPAIGGFRNSGFGAEALLSALRDRRPEPVRAKQRYSQASIALAGEVIQRVSSLTWEEFVRERIFEPLGMSRSFTSNPDLVARFGEPDATRNIFIPAVKAGGEVRAGDWSDVGTHRLYAPAGGITSNGSDLAKWISFLTQNGSFEGERLITEEALAATFEPLIPLDPLLESFTTPIAPLAAGTTGWTVVPHAGRRVYFAPGGWMSSVVAIVPEEDLGVGIFTNAYFSERHGFESLFPAFALAMKAVDITLALPATDWDARFEAALAATLAGTN